MLDLVGNPEDRFYHNEAHLFPDSALVTSLRAHSDEQFFLGKDQLSQKLLQSICVHTQQRKVLKKLYYRIFVNVSFFVLQVLQKAEGVCSFPHL